MNLPWPRRKGLIPGIHMQNLESELLSIRLHYLCVHQHTLLGFESKGNPFSFLEYQQKPE